jgi:hypothetical protein
MPEGFMLDTSYAPVSIFPEEEWDVNWPPMGTVVDIEIYW